ncbi:MAG: hypothetical protein HY079_07265 [Elusimicrobia bacterium]|nr:hypothetical protein [Elusimicrobiota bacterium]
MKIPLLLLAVLLSAAPASSAVRPDRKAAAAADELPLKLGAKTPEGFDDPEHVHFFRYQAYLKKNGLEGLDADAWKALNDDQRAEKLKKGEEWLKDKFTALMSSNFINDGDAALLASVWGPSVRQAAEAVAKSLKLGDPEQIKAARERAQSLVKGVGGASVDWAAVFDGAAPGAVSAPNLPDPLALKTNKGFLGSLTSPEVQAPLASKATFLRFLQQKDVPADAVPAMAAMYDVLTRAKGPEKAETAHLLPTVVRFLSDGKKIVHEDMEGALAFAVPGDYDRPEKVGITSAMKTADPVMVGSVLAHEFQHIHDMYSGRYYTLDSELRGFKTNALFIEIMRKDPQLSKKLDELMNSDDDNTRLTFHRDAQVGEALARDPRAFADEVAFGNGYNRYYEGTFSGRLPLREATDPQTGLQRQISAQQALLARARQETATQQRLVAAAKTDRDLEKATRDLNFSQRREISLQYQITVSTMRLNRMNREVTWMDKRAAAAGRGAPPYDLSLPVDKDYVVDGD